MSAEGRKARRTALVRTLQGIVILGPFGLLVVAALHGVISERQLMAGVVAWWIALLIVAGVRKLHGKEESRSVVRARPPVDERGRRRILRSLWLTKLWVALLLAALPVAFVVGYRSHAWLPILVGVGMNLLFIYVALQEIKRRKRQLEGGT